MGLNKRMFMNKFKLIACMLLLNTYPLQAKTNNQLYAALNGGVFQGDFNATYLDQSDLIPQNISVSSLQNAYTGGLAIGFIHPINASTFLGLELLGNLDSNSALFQSGAANTAFSDTVKMRRHLDLTLVPGLINLGSYAPYLKLGLSYAAIQDSLISPVGYDPIMTAYNTNKTASGFVAALGVKHSMGEHLGLFAEVNYHDYGTINFTEFDNFTANYTHSARLYTYGLVVGVSSAVNV